MTDDELAALLPAFFASEQHTTSLWDEEHKRHNARMHEISQYVGNAGNPFRVALADNYNHENVERLAAIIREYRRRQFIENV